jgi:hypothetical protein
MTPTISQVLSSKTVRYAIVIAILSVLQGFVFLLPIKPVEQMVVGLVLAVGIVVFRFVTTEPLEAK